MLNKENGVDIEKIAKKSEAETSEVLHEKKKFGFLIDDTTQDVEVPEEVAKEKLEEMISFQKPNKKKK